MWNCHFMEILHWRNILKSNINMFRSFKIPKSRRLRLVVLKETYIGGEDIIISILYLLYFSMIKFCKVLNGEVSSGITLRGKDDIN